MAGVGRTLKEIVRQALYWGLPLPRGVSVSLAWAQHRREITRGVAQRPYLRENAALKNRHRGQRCFILASGPSVKQQDLLPLKDEIVISVSNTFVHPDYGRIKPRYHCVPDVFHGHADFVASNEDRYLNWFRQMDARTGEATMFISAGDRAKLLGHGIFTNRRVHYLLYGLNWARVEREGIDLCRALPSPQSVSVLALCLALYMGFAEVYLLGCDHDWLAHYGTSAHFYETKDHVVLAQKGYSEWAANTGMEGTLSQLLLLWQQYIALRGLAAAQGTAIYYATPKGWLDVFPPADLAVVVGHRRALPEVNAASPSTVGSDPSSR